MQRAAARGPRHGARRLKAARTLLLLAPLVAQAASLEPGDHAFALEHGHRERHYIVHVPPQPRQPAPVILNFHGGGGHAAAQQEYSRMDVLADREGFLAVYPDGTGSFNLLTWNAGATCCGYAHKNKVDDVGFTAALIDDLAARIPIDAKRVYATGLSNGAMMAYRLAAELPNRIAAIAPVAGAMQLPGKIAHAVPVLHIHSVDDPRALYAGGLGPPFPMTNTRVQHPAVSETLARWSEANGCKGEPRVAEERLDKGASAGHTTILLVYEGCTAALDHWKLTGAGHVWPGGKLNYLTRLLGPGTDVIDANAEMWRFFSRVAAP